MTKTIELRESLKNNISHLRAEAEWLEKRVESLKHKLSSDNIEVSLTRKVFLSAEEIIDGRFEPARDMQSFLKSKMNTRDDRYSGVYFIISEGEIVYVGQSKNIFSRLHTHAYKKTFEAFSFISLPEEEWDLTESLYIHTLRPEWNGNVGDDETGHKVAPLKMTQIMELVREAKAARCKTCDGSGEVWCKSGSFRDFKRWVETCPDCEGSGKSGWNQMGPAGVPNQNFQESA